MKIVKHYKDFNEKKAEVIEILPNDRIITKIFLWFENNNKKCNASIISKELNVSRKILWSYEKGEQCKPKRFIGLVTIWCIKNNIEIKDFLTNKEY